MTTASIEQRSARAGHGLAAHAITWGTRNNTPKPTAPTSRDFHLMTLLYDTNYLSASQLTILGWGRDSDAAGKRLRRLHNSGFIDKFRGPSPGRVGTSEWNYRLAHDGWQTLKDHGMVEGDNYQPAELHSIAYAEHDLQVNALVLHIAQAIAAPQNTPLHSRMPFLWQGPRTGRIDPQTPAAVQASDAARIPPEDRLHHEQSRYGYLEPDATLTAQIGTDRFAILIEYDRTGRPNKQIDRLRRYDYWLLDGWRHTHFAAHAIPPTVLILTAKSGPLASLIQTADQTLTAWHGPPHANPAEGIYPGRQRIIFTTRDNILEGNWTMYRTPSLPSSASEQAIRTPRTIDYSLPELLKAQK